NALQAASTDALGAINAPTLALFNRPLIGNGADGLTPGANGQDGGILWGNGGNGAAGAAGASGVAGSSGGNGGNGGSAGLF
ncbi:PE family protein, partial [Mycobacterium kansasii]